MFLLLLIFKFWSWILNFSLPYTVCRVNPEFKAEMSLPRLDSYSGLTCTEFYDNIIVQYRHLTIVTLQFHTIDLIFLLKCVQFCVFVSSPINFQLRRGLRKKIPDTDRCRIMIVSPDVLTDISASVAFSSRVFEVLKSSVTVQLPSQPES